MFKLSRLVVIMVSLQHAKLHLKFWHFSVAAVTPQSLVLNTETCNICHYGVKIFRPE